MSFSFSNPSLTLFLESVLRPYKINLPTLAPKNLKTARIKIIRYNWIH